MGATLTIEYTVAAGSKTFCLDIKQDPYIGVTIDTVADPNAVNIQSAQLADATLAAQEYTNDTGAVPTATNLLASTNTSCAQLEFDCDKNAFRDCIENAVVHCYDRAQCELKKIRWVCLFDCIRPKIAICIVKIADLHCAPEHKPEPHPPAPHPESHQPSHKAICTFLNICVKASVIIEACFSGNLPKYVHHVNMPNRDYIKHCESMLRVNAAVAVETKAQLLKKHCPPKKHPLPVRKQKKKHEDSSSDDEKDKKDGYSTGAYIAGGVGVTVVVSVCVYVGYSFLS